MIVVRLSVNLNQETAAALKDLSESKGLNYTEVTRLAISVAKFIHDEHERGRKIHTMDADGGNEKELVIL